MNKLKLILIHVADFVIDEYILRHRFHSVCCKISMSSWWGPEEFVCSCWLCKRVREDTV
jgi:hypothetical protein